MTITPNGAAPGLRTEIKRELTIRSLRIFAERPLACRGGVIRKPWKVAAMADLQPAKREPPAACSPLRQWPEPRSLLRPAPWSPTAGEQPRRDVLRQSLHRSRGEKAAAWQQRAYWRADVVGDSRHVLGEPASATNAPQQGRQRGKRQAREAQRAPAERPVQSSHGREDRWRQAKRRTPSLACPTMPVPRGRPR